MLETVSLSYHIKKSPLIHQIDLSFNPGRLYGILGPNGAGKSTLLKTMAGIWLPTEGSVCWKGNSIQEMPREEISRLISFVFQQTSSSVEYSVYEMVAMGRYLHNDKSRAVESSLRQADLWDLKDQKMFQLSGGERQRVYIARALATEAPILLLDEPMTYLDISHQLEVWNLLQQLSQSNKLIIVSTHDIMAASRFCDDLVVLSNGECVAKGAAAAVLTPKIMGEVFGLRTAEEHGSIGGLLSIKSSA